VDDSKYKSLLAKIMYIATHTRPDILFSVMYLATKAANPVESNYNALMHILSYLKNTINKKMIYKPITSNVVTLYSDASHNLHPDSKGQSGCCIFLGNNDACIYSRSTKQHINSSSSYDAELIALDDGTKTLSKVKDILTFLGFNPTAVIKEDNDPAITTLTNPFNCTDRSKGINNRVNSTKERMKDDKMSIEYCKTELMIADVMTKVLQPKDFIRYTKQITNS
jgi:flagellar hook protein FlgE